MKPLIIAIVSLSSAVSAFAAGQPADAELVKQGDALAARGDYKKAAALYEKAARHSYPAAECKLGKAYCAGQGVPTNFTLGKQWLKRAAAHGSKDAKYGLEDLQKLEQMMGVQVERRPDRLIIFVRQSDGSRETWIKT